MIAGRLNIFKECESANLLWWQCPPLLFLIMGVLTISSMILTSVIASRYFEEPELPTILGVTFVAVLFLVIGNLIIAGFNRIAEANRMKTEFIWIASHQLRTPLSIFRWTLDLMKRNLLKQIERRESDEETETFLYTLKNSTERMMRMVNTLLDVSRIEVGTIAWAREEFSLEDVTKKEIENFHSFGNASNVKIIFEVPEAFPKVVADRMRTAAIMGSLLDNAIRYTNEGNDVIIRIEKEGDANLRWSVVDRGMGIPAKQQKFVFTKFFRADNAKAKRTIGSGIGLFIAKSVVEIMGGKIGFESEEDKGSKFWFTLPIKK